MTERRAALILPNASYFKLCRLTPPQHDSEASLIGICFPCLLPAKIGSATRCNNVTAVIGLSPSYQEGKRGMQ